LFLVLHKLHSLVSTQTQNMHKAKGESTSVSLKKKFALNNFLMHMQLRSCVDTTSEAL